MKCKTCGDETNQAGIGLIIQNMKVIPCPDCRHGEVKMLYGVNYQLPENDLYLAVNRLS